MVDLRRKWTGFIPYDCSLSMSCMTVVTISLSLVEKRLKELSLKERVGMLQFQVRCIEFHLDGAGLYKTLPSYNCTG